MGHQDCCIDSAKVNNCAEFIRLQYVYFTAGWKPVGAGETGPVINNETVPAHFYRQAGDGQGIMTRTAYQDYGWRHDGDQQDIYLATPGVDAVLPIPPGHVMPAGK
jgi:hypothetical protein